MELAMPHACSGAHELNLPRLEDTLISKAVAMCQRTFQDIAENFHVPVRMLGETSTETKLFDKPCRQLLFDFFVRNGVAAVDVINTFLNRCQKLHAISDLIN